MGESKTADQIRDEHFETLGPVLGPRYHAVYSEVVWLHAKWKQYRILFAESPERVELLNNAAGSFFYLIQKVLWEDVVLHVARLADPLRSRGKDNLALAQITAPDVEFEGQAFSNEISDLVKKAQMEAEFARDWRRRYLAHRDLKLAINQGATPLPAISRYNVERALSAMREVLHKVEEHFFRGQVDPTNLIVRGDAEDLVYYLKTSIYAER